MRFPPTRRSLAATAAVVVVVAAGVVAASDDDAPATSSATTTAEVTRRDLRSTLRLAGHVEQSDTRSLHWLQPPAAATGSPTEMSGMPGSPQSPASPAVRSIPPSPQPSVPAPTTREQSPPATVPPTTATTQPPTSTTTTTTPSTTAPTTATTSSTTTTTSTTTTPTTVVPPTASTTPPSAASQPLAVLPVSQTQVPSTDSQPPDGRETGGDSQAHTVTAQSTPGQQLDRGDVAFAVDGRPTVVLFGTEAAYRELSDDVDDGPDVAQLEENLNALGYDVTVDEDFDAQTGDAVEAWQADLGVEATGVVGLGDVVFVPGSVTVVSAGAAVGDPVEAGARLLDVSGGALLAVADVSVARRNDVAEGMTAEVTLADDSVVAGTVRAIDGEATRPQGAPVTDSVVEVTVQLDATGSPAAVDQAEVDVELTLAVRQDALVVPLGALVDGSDGRPAVVVSGSARPVAVEPGLAADGYLEIAAGPLDEGDDVLLPAHA